MILFVTILKALLTYKPMVLILSTTKCFSHVTRQMFLGGNFHDVVIMWQYGNRHKELWLHYGQNRYIESFAKT